MVEATAGARRIAPGVLAVVLGVIGVLSVIGVIAMARPAAANAFLVAATPSHGTALSTAPQEVLLTFSEPVEVVGDGVAVVGPDGGRVDPGTVRRPRPEVVSVPLPGVVAVTRQGTYMVTWHVVSADSRPVRGEFTFSIGTATTRTARPAATGASPVVAGGYGLAAFAALAGLTMLAGGVVLGQYGWAAPAESPGSRRLVVAGWTVLVLATLALLALRGPYAAGAGLARAADGDLLGQTLHSHYGRAMAVRLVLLGAVPVLLAKGIGRTPGPGRWWRLRLVTACLVVAVGLALTWAAVGDAATAGSLAPAAGTVRLLAAVTWLGCLVAVPVALRAVPNPNPEPDPQDRPAHPPPVAEAAGGVATSAKTAATPVVRAAGAVVLARRLGRLTAACLPLIIIAGGYLERHALGGAAELLTTTYGRLLTIKIVALGGVLAVAVRLRGRLRAPDGRGSAGSATRRLAVAGVAIAAVVLALTTVLAEVRPAAQEQAGRPVTRSGRFNVGAGAAAGVLEVRLPRTSRGVDAAGLTVLIGGRPLDLPGLQAAWSQPAIGVGPLPVRFTRVGTGRYRLGWPPLPVAGRWRLRITSGSNGAMEITWRIT